VGSARQIGRLLHLADALPDPDTPTAPPVTSIVHPTPSITEPPTTTPTLVDAWPGAEPFALDGSFDRAGWHPMASSALVFVSAFVMFQVVGGVAMLVGPILDAVRAGTVPTDPMDLLTDSPAAVLGGNALGQAVAFGLFAVLAARWSSRRWRPFVRLRRPDGAGLALAALGWVALYPVVLFLGDLNAKLPLPGPLQAMDDMRAEMLESLLLGGEASTAFLLLTVALTPAIFEELLFRGYLMRQVERVWGIGTAIVATGVFFGAYHLSITQLVPLSVLGIYMGFVVWATGSLWTGVLVHLLNNGLAVLIAAMARTRPEMNVDSLEGLGVSWYLGLAMAAAGAVAVAGLVRAMVARRHAVTGGAPDARPLPLPSPALP